MLNLHFPSNSPLAQFFPPVQLTPLGAHLVDKCGVDVDDAAIASRAFAAKNYKVTTVEKLSKLEPADFEEAIAAAKAEGLSASAKGVVVKLWSMLQTLAPTSPLSPTSPVRKSNDNGYLDAAGGNAEADPTHTSTVSIAIESKGVVSFDKDGDVLGKGAFGTVYQGMLDAEVVAVKVIDLSEVKPAERAKLFRMFEKEVKALEKLKHRNIVSLKASAVADIPTPMLVLAMEFMGGGSLYDLLADRKELLTPTLQVSYVHQLFAAVEYLSRRGVIHRDIKSPNVLVDSSSTVLKLCDFGLVTTDPSVAVSMASLATKTKIDGGGSLVGTFIWMAPEVIEGGAWSSAGDAYSLASAIVEVMTKELPYTGLNATQLSNKKMVRRMSPLDYHYEKHGIVSGGQGSFPLTLEVVLKAMFAHDPADRPSVEAAASVLGVGCVERSTAQSQALLVEFQAKLQERAVAVAAAAAVQAPQTERPLVDLVAEIKGQMGIETKSMGKAVEEAAEELGITTSGTLKDKTFAVAKALSISVYSNETAPPPLPPPPVLYPLVPPPPPEQASSAAPEYRCAVQEESHFEEKNHEVEVSVKKLAAVVAACAQAYTGNLPGLFASLAGDVESLTLSFGAAQQDATAEKTALEYDPASGWFILMKLTKKASLKRGMLGFVTGAKKSIKVSLFVCKVQGMNASAKEALRQAHSEKTAGLMSRIRDLPLFLCTE
jgi:predicted Ser/Thr protein kinase